MTQRHIMSQRSWHVKGSAASDHAIKGVFVAPTLRDKAFQEALMEDHDLPRHSSNFRMICR